MQILGNYQSTLSSSYYQQLVTLLQQAIQAGDFGGGQTFDQAALVALQQEAQNFSTLPQSSAGQVVTDESFNHPLTLLAAQFAALLNESNAFATQLTALLAVLSKDTALVDQLLAEANLQTWASTIPAVTGANQIMWDFGVGYGPIAPLSLTEIWTDPATSATYPNNPTLSSNLATVLLPGLATTASGLTPPQSIATVSVNNLTWTYTTDNAQVEVLNQDNWTKLTLLEPQPLINFSSTPSVTPAASPFVVTGASNLGSLPVYIQTSFVGRQRHTTAAATNGTTISLSPYTVDTDEVYVFVGYGTTKQQLLSSATDYTVDPFTKEKQIGRCHVDVFIGPWAVVEIQGCYWHKHSCHRPKAGWTAEDLAVQARDSDRFAYLKAQGYQVVVIWECEIERDQEWIRSLLRNLKP